MKARLLIDSKGPNPEFKTPDPRGPDGATALRLYKIRVPVDIVHPAGTILDGAEAWQHCVMDGSGDGTRGIPGIILAEPFDEDCRLVVDDELSRYTPLQRKMYDLAKSRADVHSKRLADERAKVEALLNSEPEPQVDSE